MSVRDNNSFRPVCVFAHPDDEILAMGGRLQFIPAADIVIVTDGAPPWAEDPLALATKRRAESRAALSRIQTPHRLFFFGFTDQTVAAHAATLIEALRPFINHASTIFTHALEHGHPDHDAVCLGVHAAALVVNYPNPIFECPLYHENDGRLLFSASHEGDVLDAATVELKREMLDCFRSQHDFIEQFPIHREAFRAIQIRREVTMEALLSPYPDRIPSLASDRDWQRLHTLLEAAAS